MRRTSLPRPTLAQIVPNDILGALTALGIDADVREDEAKALCPNPDHDDTSPSWSCNLETGQHHCFSCGYGGSFAYLVACMLGYTRANAELWVRDRQITDVADGNAVPREIARKRAAEVSETDLWRFTDPPAGALESRGLALESCQRYEVMWDNDRELWITPVRDPLTGKLWGWQEKNERVFNNHPKYLAKSKAVFGLSVVPDGGTVVLVESPLDVPFVHGRCPADVYPVSGYGAAVSASQVDSISRRAGLVILAMDNDLAGWKSAYGLAFAFGTLPVRVFDYGNTSRTAPGIADVGEPDGRDPGDLTADEITWGLRNAILAWELSIPWLS